MKDQDQCIKCQGDLTTYVLGAINQDQCKRKLTNFKEKLM